MGLKTEVRKVTPAMAKKWLDENNHPDNRSVGWGRVEAIANDIREGNWRTTHQGICFDAEGRLIDGQHRLHAIVSAGIAVMIMVTTNDEAHFQDPIDRGSSRTVATVTGLHSRVTGALAMLHRMELGVIATTTPVTVAETLETLTHQKKWMDVIDSCKDVNHSSLLAGFRAACVWTMPIDQEKTMEFLVKVVNGEMISRGDPAYAYRRWRERTDRIKPDEMMYATLNCLRYHIGGKKLSSVFIGESGYRCACSKRRAMRVQHTPSVDIVPSLSWSSFDRGGAS